MGEIYRQAKGVVIWLGPPPSSRPGFDRLFADLVKYAESNDNKEREATWKTLRVLLERTWFQRRWTIQEVILAKQATILCGRYSVDFMAFAKNAWLIAQGQPFFKALFSGILRKLWMMYKLRLALGTEAHTDALSLLVEFAPAECSNEHDRIYALNGLTDVPSSTVVELSDQATHLYPRGCQTGATSLATHRSPLRSCLKTAITSN
jgi:hypothetical protein